ncbi:acyl-CoA dehydrogenase family protein [Amycolatopsis sp. NPDC048633]|uniref:acyl-CoA dehydrogenase family protein n=1 Tax=Amycolatopsis sp. NPDC048633 TaxID=3157095 RepID=UPI0033C911CE
MDEELDELRRVVRELVAGWDFEPRCDAWMRGHDPEFSRELAQRGLIGITWPTSAGGAGKSNVERLVVTEELLRVGAPVAAHWIADRQIGPAILRSGSPELRREILPRIAAGDITFCLGMSETESGSDLASVRTRAVRTADGWRLDGRKIWTTQGHHATHAYVLARTADGDDRHDGLTEFVVDMSTPGVSVRPILDLSGEHHFNEVLFDDVRLPAGSVIGVEGGGWKQVTEQLSFERGGMERVLSTFPLLDALAARDLDASGRAAVGVLVARLMTLRELACRVASAMDAGRAPSAEAAVLKYLGTTFEREVVDVARTVSEVVPAPGAPGFAGLLAQAQLAAPGFSIRGGTDEVLLTIVSRQAPVPVVDEIGRMADEVLGSASGGWAVIEKLGWPSVGVPEAEGGSGGTFADLASLVRATGRHACAVPLAEVAIGRSLSVGAAALARDFSVHDGLFTFDAVPGFSPVAVLGPDTAAVVDSPDGTPWRDLAGRPRLGVVCQDVSAPVVAAGDASLRLVVLRVHAALGAVEGACRLTREHVTTRTQFGRPLTRFQAVAHRLAEMECARVLLEVAASAALACEPARVAAAAVLVDSVATTVARLAHQLHGAMGITQESSLHRYTTLLWSLRDELGPVRPWARDLADGDALWSRVTTRPLPVPEG